MKIHEFSSLEEMNYPGNLGVMEMFKFYQVATEAQKAHMRILLSQGKMDEAWGFLQKVTGLELQKLSK